VANWLRWGGGDGEWDRQGDGAGVSRAGGCGGSSMDKIFLLGGNNIERIRKRKSRLKQKRRTRNDAPSCHEQMGELPKEEKMSPERNHCVQRETATRITGCGEFSNGKKRKVEIWASQRGREHK